MIGATLQNRYRLDAELGQGGMGVVYRAYDTLLQREVAVKVLSQSSLGTEGRARLLREAQAVARLDHPNIVSVYDAGETNGAPFIVMQLVAGADLHNCGPLTLPEIVELARQLCDALDHAHTQGIVHRDIKPENVIVTRSGERFSAKLMDFGLARSESASRLTQEGALIGTLFYLAPEQALGQPLDGRTDLYALGVMLYELTTGRLPFVADDPVVVISQHLHAPVVPPRAHNEHIPPALDALIVQLLSKSPQDRPSSARAVLEALVPLQAQLLASSQVVPSLPSGEITFLFTDIEGSTPLWERSPDVMRESLARHNAILYEAIESHNGQVFKTIRDAFQVAFAVPVDAARAAIAAQRGLASAAWGTTGPLRVRMGLHRGPAEASRGDYVVSHTLNRVARVMSAGHGGQILLSHAVAEQVREHLPADVRLRDLGKHRLKGLSQAEHLYQLVASGLPVDFPPLNSTLITSDTGEEVVALLERIVRGRLVGREDELAEATALWQKAAAGEGGVLLVSGESGIGKTRFVRELMTHARSMGAVVLTGECYAEGSAPYAPIAQMIRQTLDDPFQRDLGLPDFVVADLLTLAPGLRLRYPNLPSNLPLDPQSEQERVYESAVEFCAKLAARAPLMLFVDDVHWADSGTLFLLRHLARRLRRRCVLIVATYREIELAEAQALHEFLLEINRERLAARIKLARLSWEQTRNLLAVMFAEEITPEFLDGVYRETEGNPFFVEEVCKALIEAGKLTFADGRWHRHSMAEIEIPQSVRVAIQTRVGKLPQSAQETLLLAAIIGREFDFETLLAASGKDEDILIDVLEIAERTQLIEEIKSKGHAEVYAFVHALIPATLRDGVSSRRLRRLHQRAANAIESLRPDDDEALAHHYAAADDAPKAIEYARRAARRAKNVYAYEAAIRHLRTALDVFEAGEQSAVRLVLLEELADVYQLRREGPQAISLYQEALTVWRAVSAIDKTTAVRLHRKIVEAHNWLIWLADVQQLAEAARASAETGLKLAEDTAPHPEIVRLLTACSYQAWIHRSPEDWHMAEHYARRAVEMGERVDAPVELSAALDALAKAYGARGLFRERIDLALRRLELSRDPRFGDARERADILNQVGATLIFVGEYPRAMPYLLEAENLADQIRDVDQQAVSLRLQSHGWYLSDRWDHVLGIEERWQMLKQRYPDHFDRVGAFCFQIALHASVHARRGAFDLARALREESVALMLKQAGSMDAWGRSNYY